MHKVELLAPAGNFECLIAAVQNGADAVYISGKSFGARSFADNFDHDELKQAVDYCHLRDTKVYVTVNTLVYDSEFAQIEDYLIFLNSIGVDALIVQDLGVIETAKRIIPEMPLHASTQMTIHNSLGVKELEKSGISRVVLSRELSLDKIEHISQNCDAELEIFSHGALCMCYSGQCLMSSIIGGRSGNRGKCAQPCRLPYSVSDGRKKAFYMSLKDLCTLEYTEAFKKLGVASLKIEGRMKGPAYVAAVVRIYRKYIDTPQKIQREDIELLDRIFNRGGLTDGYITGKTGREMFAFDKPDNPYHKENDEIVKSLAVPENTENRKLKLQCRVTITEGEYPLISITNGKTKIEYIYEKITETAMKQPLTADAVCMRIAKTGGTPFEFAEIDAEIIGNAFMTASDINSLRRGALEKFQEVFLDSFKHKAVVTEENSAKENCSSYESGFVCEVTSKEQFDAVCGFDFLRLYVPVDVAYKHEKELCSHKSKVVLVFPAIMQDGEAQRYEKMAKELLEQGFCGVVVSNADLMSCFDKNKRYGGFRLNVFNSRTINVIAKRGFDALEVSPELNLKKIKNLEKSIPIQTMVYGRLPLMVTENCVIKNGGKCPCNNGGYITDRMGMRFPVIKDGSSCRNVVLNCKKTYMADKMNDIESAGVSLFRLYFSDEKPEECMKICEAYLKGSDYCPTDYTRAHYYKGAE